MQLNETTYETIFLLYIDKELSPKECLEVEAFIAANPSYALEMEVLKATVASPELIQYPFKENLKQQAEISLEELEEDWEEDLKATYATILKEDMQTITGLSTSFKNTLKKNIAKEGIVIKPFRFSQQKLSYAAIAACLIVFLGYQQLTKPQVSDSPASNSSTANSLATNLNTGLVSTISKTISKKSGETLVGHSNQLESNIETVATANQATTIKLQASKSSNSSSSQKLQNETIAIAEATPNNSILNNRAITTKLPSSYNHPMTMDVMPLSINSTITDTETITDDKASTSYEVIDTEDPDRTIFIANFEIDGNKLRGIKRKITSLFKNNKSERNK